MMRHVAPYSCTRRLAPTPDESEALMYKPQKLHGVFLCAPVIAVLNTACGGGNSSTTPASQPVTSNPPAASQPPTPQPPAPEPPAPEPPAPEPPAPQPPAPQPPASSSGTPDLGTNASLHGMQV